MRKTITITVSNDKFEGVSKDFDREIADYVETVRDMASVYRDSGFKVEIDVVEST